MFSLVFSVIGVFGLIAHSVARRTREIGVRMACGAKPSDIRFLVVKEVLAILSMGLALGLPAAFLLSRYLKAVLFGISPMDPATLLITALVLLLTGMIAGYFPARRASSVDPLAALRCE